MKTYIALLRGINVAGQKKIKMADLRSFLSELSFQNIRTYIQSGNIIFESPKSNCLDLEQKIKTLIAEKYTFDVPVIVREAEEFIEIRDANPYFETDVEVKKLYISFLSQAPTKEAIEKFNQFCIDKNIEDLFEIKNREIHLKYSLKEMHKSKLSNNLFERILKVRATTRNWRTVNKLIELVNK
jgi:uncharacterized protein (DUF1697 family)